MWPTMNYICPFFFPIPATIQQRLSNTPPVNLPSGLEDWHEPVVPSLVAASKWRD